MKAKICFKCHRFFEEDYYYCPYCGDHLIVSDFGGLDKEKKDKSKEKTKIKIDNKLAKKDEEQSDVSFYEGASTFQKSFIDDFYDCIKSEFPQIEMKQRKSYVYFVQESDRELPNYGHWFFISKRDGIFALRYRPKPDSTIEPKIIRINKSTSLRYVADLMIEIIRSRFGGAQSKKMPDDEFDDLECKIKR